MWNKLLFCYGLKWKISPHAFSCSKFVCCIENLSSICIACHILRTSTVCFSIITLLSRGLQCIKKRKDLTTNSHFLRLMSYSEHRRTNIAIQQKLNFSKVISFICYLIFIFTFIQWEKINLEKISYIYVPSTYMYIPTGAPVYKRAVRQNSLRTTLRIKLSTSWEEKLFFQNVVYASNIFRAKFDIANWSSHAIILFHISRNILNIY